MCNIQSMDAALEDLRVSDFSRILAGPFATMIPATSALR